MEGLYGWKFAVLMKQDERPTKSSMIGDGKQWYDKMEVVYEWKIWNMGNLICKGGSGVQL